MHVCHFHVTRARGPLRWWPVRGSPQGQVECSPGSGPWGRPGCRIVLHACTARKGRTGSRPGNTVVSASDPYPGQRAPAEGPVLATYGQRGLLQRGCNLDVGGKCEITVLGSCLGACTHPPVMYRDRRGRRSWAESGLSSSPAPPPSVCLKSDPPPGRVPVRHLP